MDEGLGASDVVKLLITCSSAQPRKGEESLVLVTAIATTLPGFPGASATNCHNQDGLKQLMHISHALEAKQGEWRRQHSLPFLWVA